MCSEFASLIYSMDDTIKPIKINIVPDWTKSQSFIENFRIAHDILTSAIAESARSASFSLIFPVPNLWAIPAVDIRSNGLKW
mgnify:CR=1 FL=1